MVEFIKDQFHSVDFGDSTPQEHLENVNTAYGQWKVAQSNRHSGMASARG